jgi:hypothetical protein
MSPENGMSQNEIGLTGPTSKLSDYRLGIPLLLKGAHVTFEISLNVKLFGILTTAFQSIH